MSGNIRAYIVVFVLSAAALFLVGRWNNVLENKKHFSRWVSYWIVVTSAAFLAHNYWVFTLILVILFLVVVPKNPDFRLPVYFLLLPAAPLLASEIPGFGGIRFLFELTYPRLLALCMLLPLLSSAQRKKNESGIKPYYPTDKYVVAYILLSFVLSFRNTTFTGGLREGFYLLVDIYIPYFAISRYVRTLENFKAVMLALATSAFVLSIIAWFEAAKYWLLYREIEGVLGTKSLQYSSYMRRAGSLRVTTVFFGPIVFGYFLVIGLGALSFLKSYIPGVRFKMWGGAILVALIATVSRGPWVGFAAFVLIYSLFSANKVRALTVVTAAAVFGILLLSVVPGGEKFISVLPLIGDASEAADTISYREQLFNNGIELIRRNPFFGSTNFRQSEELASSQQNSGFVDIVNSYLKIAFSIGLVGLGLFAAMFVTLILNIRKSMLRGRAISAEHGLLGQSLLAILVAILVIIGTVSSIDFIPIYYWALTGLGAAYVNMIHNLAVKSSVDAKQMLRRQPDKVIS